MSATRQDGVKGWHQAEEVEDGLYRCVVGGVYREYGNGVQWSVVGDHGEQLQELRQEGTTLIARNGEIVRGVDKLHGVVVHEGGSRERRNRLQGVT